MGGLSGYLPAEGKARWASEAVGGGCAVRSVGGGGDALRRRTRDGAGKETSTEEITEQKQDAPAVPVPRIQAALLFRQSSHEEKGGSASLAGWQPFFCRLHLVHEIHPVGRDSTGGPAAARFLAARVEAAVEAESTTGAEGTGTEGTTTRIGRGGTVVRETVAEAVESGRGASSDEDAPTGRGVARGRGRRGRAVIAGSDSGAEGPAFDKPVEGSLDIGGTMTGDGAEAEEDEAEGVTAKTGCHTASAEEGTTGAEGMNSGNASPSVTPGARPRTSSSTPCTMSGESFDQSEVAKGMTRLRPSSSRLCSSVSSSRTAPSSPA